MAEVIVIDDSPADREMVRRALESGPLNSAERVSVHEASTVAEARAMISDLDPDCVILDYWLPETNGIDFLKSLRADSGRILPPVIFVTGHGSEKIAAETVRQRLNDYLIKSEFAPDDLRRSVDAAIERYKIERQLRRYHSALETSNSELSSFASRVAHDLRSPINVIKGYSEMLLEDGGLSDETRQDYLRSICTGVDRVDRMIQSLFQFSTIGHGATEPGRVPLDEVWNDVRSMLADDIRASDASVRFQDASPCVFGDRGLLLILFQNLIGNAIKYAGSQPLQVEVTSAIAGDKVIVSVADNGSGVPEDQRDEIFQMFHRVNMECTQPGSGIGLATCRKIVEKHEGSIWCEGNPGGGSVFRVALMGCGPDGAIL